ncbi:hypothetical protein GOP47_0004498 [Adiantum capillus-veneris]|uniref:Ribosomal protein L7/L12 C-terminal domain-containing protein n=1 Tax=Adiantum capillus-veneris TaxID=13818 RepID=A0A9D4V7K2_ADICA|nr:hypothetical protein GOP47_0004498 [Adiantum capillus-veneris]
MNWFPRWRRSALSLHCALPRKCSYVVSSSLEASSSLKLLYPVMLGNVLHSGVEVLAPVRRDDTSLWMRQAYVASAPHALCRQVDAASFIRHLHSSTFSQGAASKLNEALVDSSEDIDLIKPADCNPLDHDKAEPVSASSAKILQLVNEIANLTLLEASDLSYLLKKRLGLPDSAMPFFGGGVAANVGGTPATASVEEEKKPEKTNFDVKLEKYDVAAKIKIIKEVRTFTSLGLKEAKELVEKLPAILKKGVAKEEADQIIEKLKAVGATVVLE